MYGYGGFYKKPTMAQMSSQAARQIRAAAKRGEDWKPIHVRSTRGSLASSWWGQAWCDNLESYADFENRVARGKRYVRSDAVLDLRIEKGLVRAKVLGSQGDPYTTKIEIDPLPPERLEELISRCGSRARDLESLVSGEFPEDLKHVFYDEGGLFPSPDEIAFGCSCPDWAVMCKHVAAVLYGIGVRFDEDPTLFFRLRGIDPGVFIETAVKNRLESMLENADKPSRRIMDDSSWHELFGLQPADNGGLEAGARS